MNSSPLPSTAISPAKRRNLPLTKDAARLLYWPAAHAGRGPSAGAAFDREPAAAHPSAGPDADVALDPDLAAVHVLPDPVEPVARALDPQPVGVADAQSKRVADRHAMLGRLQ